MRPRGSAHHKRFVADDGCEHSSSCLRCTLARCKYDDPVQVQRGRQRRRDDAILEAHRREGLTVSQLSRRFLLSERTIWRILKGNGSRGR